MPTMQWRSIALLLVALLLGGCTASPEVTAASCEDVAHQVADVVVESADAKAKEFDAEGQAFESEVPALQPEAEEADAFATATAIAGSSEAGAALEVRLEDLEHAARELECGEDGWADEVVAADLNKELKRRYETLDGEPTAEEYVALNILATLLVVMDGDASGTRP